MRRREFIAALGGAAAWPLAARSQRQAVARIGFLDLAPASAWVDEVAAFRAGLSDFGYIEGKNIVIEFRWADTVDQLPERASELVRMKVDVIIAPASTEVEPVRQATKTIPIVFAQHADWTNRGRVLRRLGEQNGGRAHRLRRLVAVPLSVLAGEPSQSRDLLRAFHFAH